MQSSSLDGMMDVKNKCCEEEGCDTRPNYGYHGEKATRCSTHHLDGMIDVVSKRCEKCENYRVWKNCPKDKSQLCLGCFGKAFPNHPRIRRTKTKEIFFLYKIQHAVPEISIRADKVIRNDCDLQRRPDYFFEGIYRDLNGECDENGHSGYDTTCEEARLHNLIEANGYRPIHVFRFNPDAKPLPVIINKETGIASEGPGYQGADGQDLSVIFVPGWNGTRITL